MTLTTTQFQKLGDSIIMSQSQQILTKLRHSVNSNNISNSGSQFAHANLYSGSHTPINNHYNSNHQHSHEMDHEHSHSDYQLVIQFQLRREREKNRILEERLNNKEAFIQQMKQYQEQLTAAFEKCQEQLITVRKDAENFLKLERDYLEQIADLKHLVIRLEDEVTMREKEVQRRHYSSVKAQEISSPIKGRQQRSKTLMNNQEASINLLKDPIEEQLIQESKKIAKFLKQFLMMTQCFQTQAKQGTLKNRLKIAWRWIKVSIKQWNQLKRQKIVFDQFLKKANLRLKNNQTQSQQQLLAKILKAVK